MNTKLSVVIICGNALRHKFLVNYVSENLNVVGVICEAKRQIHSGEIKDEKNIIQKHLKERDDTEREFFGGNDKFKISEDKLISVEYGHSNDSEVFEWLKSRKSDYIILFGSSIIKEHILDFYKNRVINMHLGLSPYYRGSGTNFWPLVFREPECVGITIHIATKKVDAGAILAQARPKPDIKDHCHELGCKTIIEGTKLLTKLAPFYYNKQIKPKKQNLKEGKVFRGNDFTANSILKMWHNFDTGMMKEYIENYKTRTAKYPILEYKQ